jgi:hypothetical protein
MEPLSAAKPAKKEVHASEQSDDMDRRMKFDLVMPQS